MNHKTFAVRGGRLGVLAALLTMHVCIAPDPATAAVLQAETPSFGTIPAIDGNTLAGEHVRLPADLAGGRSCILVVGFSKQARDAAKDWGKRLAVDFFDSRQVAYYEAPVLAGVPRLMRGMVLHSIASEVSDRGKHHFLPITGDEAGWRKLAGVTDPDAIYLLVIDSTGEVRWRTSGPLTEAAYAALRQHLPGTAR